MIVCRHKLRLFAVAMSMATAGWAQNPRPTSTFAQAMTKVKAEGFTGQVVLGDRSRILFDETVGLARPPRHWTWGSVSKQVTAALIMAEVQRGALKLDDTVVSRLPAFANKKTGSATIRQLLQHTSGLANPDDAVPEDRTAPFYLRSGARVGGTDDALGTCASATERAAGKFAYNNCDTIVLGAILERSAGMPFARLLASRLTGPLRLARTRMARPGEHPVRARSSEPLPNVNIATFGPAGAIVGSARDLLAFDQALLSKRFLTEASIAEMWAGEPSLGYVALGAWSFEARLAGCRSPVALIERRGAVDGVQARNIIAPKIGRALVVFTDNADLKFGEIWQGKGLGYEMASAAFC